MAESFETRLMRWKFNLFPAYRGTGARITYIADDWREVRVQLRLYWRTRNYVGTIFGGSMYAAVDPIFMVMLIKLLGPDYMVWDKLATIHFKRPGRRTLHARFKLDEEELASIRSEFARAEKLERVYHVDLVDKQGVVHASVEKTIHVRRSGSNRSEESGP